MNIYQNVVASSVLTVQSYREFEIFLANAAQDPYNLLSRKVSHIKPYFILKRHKSRFPWGISLGEIPYGIGNREDS